MERRTAGEPFEQMFSWILDTREHEVLATHEAVAGETHTRVMSAMASGGAGLDGLGDFADDLACGGRQPTACLRPTSTPLNPVV